MSNKDIINLLDNYVHTRGALRVISLASCYQNRVSIILGKEVQEYSNLLKGEEKELFTEIKNAERKKIPLTSIQISKENGRILLEPIIAYVCKHDSKINNLYTELKLIETNIQKTVPKKYEDNRKEFKL